MYEDRENYEKNLFEVFVKTEVSAFLFYNNILL